METFPRLICDRERGLEKYGCSTDPEPEVLAYGSSTASTISFSGYAAAAKLYQRLEKETGRRAPSAVYEQELSRIRGELLKTLKLDSLTGLDTIFAASGTDLHLLTAQLARSASDAPLLAIMVELAETGGGVLAALKGRHFVNHTAYDDVVVGEAIGQNCNIDLHVVPLHAEDGQFKDIAIIDADVSSSVESAVAAGRRVLLNTVDVSKTGLIAPSLACVFDLRRRFPNQVDVLVDACQFRLASSTLRAYLEEGLWVGVTGSKFYTGPTFSGVLFLPPAVAQRMHNVSLPPALRAYSACADWPLNWAARRGLAQAANYGLLLRWEAALNEMCAFEELSAERILAFFKRFAAVINDRIASESLFSPLTLPDLNRNPLPVADNWDSVRTIFPFLLRHEGTDGSMLNRDETKQIYKLLNKESGINLKSTVTKRRCQVGQPVLCADSHGMPVGALRLCMSARLAVDALASHGRGEDIVIDEALLVLDKTAQLIRQL